jgi:glycosyltransferase involved in cell wall biosynthesis
MTVQVSVVVCTHNRSNYLAKALDSLLDQSLNPDMYEILVVDNASRDATRDVVADYRRRAGNIQYVFEGTLGLSHARNTGIQQSHGELVAYLDDDAIAATWWLEAALEAFRERGPRVGCIAGPVYPIWEAPRPTWLPDELVPYLSMLDYGEEARFLEETDHIVGANMAFPRECLVKVGGFPINLGRRGKRLLSNEELVLRRALERDKFRTFYSPAMRVEHHVPPERLTRRWFLSRLFWQGVSDVAKLVGNAEESSRLDTFRETMVGSRKAAGAFLKVTRTYMVRGSEPARFLEVCRLLREAGRVWGRLVT